MSRKVIITCAVTGAIHTPSMSPHPPIKAQAIADAAIGAVVLRQVIPPRLKKESPDPRLQA